PSRGPPGTAGLAARAPGVLDRAAPGVPLVLDASRIVENACWARRHEPDHTVTELVRQFVGFDHITVLSGRKDIGAPHGGLVLAARQWPPRVPRSHLPAQTLVGLLYVLAGLRTIGTPAGVVGDEEVVRVAVRHGAIGYLTRALPVVAATCRKRTSGLRRA